VGVRIESGHAEGKILTDKAEHHPGRRRLSTLITVAVIAAATGGCAAETEAPRSADPAQTSTTTTVGESAPAAGPEEGTWMSEPLDRDAFRRTLAAAGLGDYAPQFVADVGDEVVLTLELGDGFWTQYRAVDGAAEEVNDRGTYEVVGRAFVFSPDAGGANTYRWTVEKDRLTLRFVSTTEAPFEGAPAEVYQRGYYTAAPFTRIS